MKGLGTPRPLGETPAPRANVVNGTNTEPVPEAKVVLSAMKANLKGNHDLPTRKRVQETKIEEGTLLAETTTEEEAPPREKGKEPEAPLPAGNPMLNYVAST